MRELCFGVAGIGLRGGLARLAVRPDRGVSIGAICDVLPASVERGKAIYGNDVRAYRDYAQLVADDEIDAIFILTPDYLHEEHACMALEAGKAIYLEKPMAITTEGADRILATAARTHSPVYVGHNMRHAGYVQEMKQLIDRGDIGEVKAVWVRHFVGNGGDFYFRDWHAERRYANSLLLQKGAHDIDIIHWLGGGYCVATQAFGGSFVYSKIKERRKGPVVVPAWSEEDLQRNWPPRSLPDANPVIDVEDLSVVQMQLDNGVIATYDQCHFTPDYWRNYTVIGDEGRLENFGNGEPGTAVRVWRHRSGYEPRGDLTIRPRTGGEGHGGSDQRCVDEFIALVQGEVSETVTSPIAARQAVATACAASDSLRAGGGLKRPVPLDDELARYFSRRT